MPQEWEEGKLTFTFPDAWHICRLEKSGYYKNQFARFSGGCKEMDFLAYDEENRVLWLIEVKDYSVHGRSKPSELSLEIAQKTRDTLAVLSAAKINDQSLSDSANMQVGDFSRRAQNAEKIRLVLHCELPRVPSALFPKSIDEANLQHKLRQETRCIDPHARITDTSRNEVWQWSSKRTPPPPKPRPRSRRGSRS